MLEKLSWNMLDESNDLVGWLVYCKNAKNRSWYFIIKEYIREIPFGSYGLTEEDALNDFKMKDYCLLTPNKNTLSRIIMSPIKKIF